MLGFNGGLMGVRRTPTTGAASGLWSQNEQSVAKRAVIWPISGGQVTRYVRFANFANTSLNSDTLDLAEIRFFNGDTVYTGITCTTSFGWMTGNAGMLVDGDLTSRSYSSIWSDFQSTATISFDFGSSSVITHLQIYIWYENTSGPRFPATFDFQTSSDGTTYTTALSITKGTCTTDAGNVFKTAKLSLSGHPVPDPYWANVSLLLRCDGTNGSTAFTDSSSNALAVTVNGNAQISTAQSKFGGASALLDGSGDYLGVAASSLFNVGNGALFTVECHARPSTLSGNGTFLSMRNQAAYAPFELIRTNGSIRLMAANATLDNWSVNSSSASSVFTVNQWSHVALVGNGSQLTVFVDGISVITVSQASWTSANRQLFVGGGGDNQFAGNIDEVRFTLGVARYTANFTPPDAQFPQGNG
jgi:hypothetical protein